MSVTSIPPSILLRVLVADSGSSVNDGLTALLSELEGISVFGCVQAPAKVLALVQTVHPDVVILDLHMAGPIGLKTLKQIKQRPHPPVVIVLSDDDMPSVHQAALTAGADHFILKTDCVHLQAVLRDLLSDCARGVHPCADAPAAGAPLPVMSESVERLSKRICEEVAGVKAL